MENLHNPGDTENLSPESTHEKMETLTYDELLQAVVALKQSGVEDPYDMDDPRVAQFRDLVEAWQMTLELPVRGAETKEQAELTSKRIRLLFDGGFATSEIVREAIDELFAEINLAKEKAENAEVVAVFNASISELEAVLVELDKSESVENKIENAFHLARAESMDTELSEAERVSRPIATITAIIIGTRFKKYFEKHPDKLQELKDARESYRPAFEKYWDRVKREKREKEERKG